MDWVEGFRTERKGRVSTNSESHGHCIDLETKISTTHALANSTAYGQKGLEGQMSTVVSDLHQIAEQQLFSAATLIHLQTEVNTIGQTANATIMSHYRNLSSTYQQVLFTLHDELTKLNNSNLVRYEYYNRSLVRLAKQVAGLQKLVADTRNELLELHVLMADVHEQFSVLQRLLHNISSNLLLSESLSDNIMRADNLISSNTKNDTYITWAEYFEVIFEEIDIVCCLSHVVCCMLSFPSFRKRLLA